MGRVLTAILWIAVAALGAAGFAVIALQRGETISAAWILVAGVCTYLVAYRFYARFIATRIFALDPRRATPAERLNNGRDFRPDQPVGRLRPPFRRDLGRRPARSVRRWRRSSAFCPAPSG